MNKSLLFYILIGINLFSAGLLIAYTPDPLTLAFLLVMLFLVLLGTGITLISMIQMTGALRRGQLEIDRAAKAEGSAWNSLEPDFFKNRKLDQIFRQYADKVNYQKKTGQLVSDIDDFLNEDILSLISWSNVTGLIPGSLTGIGILGTFVGLIIGIRDVRFSTEQQALESVQVLLSGVDVAFYTSIAGVILSILFSMTYRILRNSMERELGIFSIQFHKFIIPTVAEQERYRHRREYSTIIEYLSRIPKPESGMSFQSVTSGQTPLTGNESYLMPQIASGLKNNEFIFVIQPRYSLEDHSVTGGEALVRWKHPLLGMLQPASFLPLMEQNGYVTQLDRCIWESVCKTIRAWIDAGYHLVPIAVNISKTDILAMDVAAFFGSMLEKYRIPPRYLDMEFPEEVWLNCYQNASELEDKLIAAGFRVIVGHFDGDFVKLNSNGRVLAGAVMLDFRNHEGQLSDSTLMSVAAQARSQHLDIYAEGVETMQDLSRLKKAGYMQAQGLFLSEPVTTEKFEEITFKETNYAEEK
jgi:EAL domain-containing protein (putative c-di-GMP-specific phosphodiesterase class I)